MDWFNYKKVCEQESYIHYLEEKLMDANKLLEEHVKYSKGLEQQLYTVSAELGKYKSLEAGLAQLHPQLGKKTKKKVNKDKIGFLN